MLDSAPAEGSVTAAPNGGRAAAYAALERDVDLFADMDFESTAAVTSTVSGDSSIISTSVPAPTPPITRGAASSGDSNLIPITTVTQINENEEFMQRLPITSSDVEMLPFTSSTGKMLPATSSEDKQRD